MSKHGRTMAFLMGVTVAAASPSAAASWVQDVGCARSITDYGAPSVDGTMTQWKIDCSGDGSSPNSSISRRVRMPWGEIGPWQQVPGLHGHKIALSVNGTRPWVTTTTGAIFRWSGSAWEGMPGCGFDLAIGRDDKPWLLACSEPHGIWHWNGTAWERMFGTGIAIADGFVISTDLQVYSWEGYWQGRGGQAWVITADVARSVSTGDVTTYVLVVGTDNQIYRWDGWYGWNVALPALPSGLPIVALLPKIAIDLNGSIWKLVP